MKHKKVWRTVIALLFLGGILICWYFHKTLGCIVLAIVSLTILSIIDKRL